mmetsp:Transcript_20109/g.58152  ORF Transcript_20109/g.58152 Transcript_20109/m.58152 type:complete len:321 (-) Transcript_20109:62-1024(-)
MIAGRVRLRQHSPQTWSSRISSCAIISIPFFQTVSAAFATSSRAAWADAATRASDILSSAESVLFVTGAGISAESGLPTYRGVSGLYTSDDGATEDAISIEECLSGATYNSDPALTWKYLCQIERSCRGASPSRAHQLVAAAEKVMPGQVTVMTQNVDGLHGRAGSSDVLCLHGELHKLRCDKSRGLGCGHTHDVEDYESLDDAGIFPPPCPKCGSPVRPSVVLFDEYLGYDTIQTYEDRLGMSSQNLWNSPKEVSRYDVSVCIGTSAIFQYVNAAALSGRHTIEINPEKTPLSGLVDVYIPAGASEALSFIYDKNGWLP